MTIFVAGAPVSNDDLYLNDYYAEYYNDEYVYDDNKNESIPKFVSTPKNMMVNEGDTIKLPCTVNKWENYVILWKKGNEILALGDKPFDDGKGDTRLKIEPTTNGNRLVISLADFSDEGEYTCQLSAGYLGTIELKHTVRVRGN